MNRRFLWSLALLAALVPACGGAGPDADADKTDEEIRKAAADMDKADLEKVIEEYKKAIKDADAAKKAELTKKMGFYAEALGKKKE